MNPARHGEDGWELIEYSWDEDTGDCIFVYERIVEGILETQTSEKKQMKYWVHPALRETVLPYEY
jgi:hypothetical protein